MNRNSAILILLFILLSSTQTNATVELLYLIKEQSFEQHGNDQPGAAIEWSFGIGAMGDTQLTAMSYTMPGSVEYIALPGQPGGFDLDPEPFSSQQDLDAVFPNGSYGIQLTDNAFPQNLGPYALTGDTYPAAPHMTNVLELQSSDYSQDFLLTWDAYSGYNEGDQILIQVFDAYDDTDLIFEFLDASATSFVIPGGTFQPDRYYEVQLVFSDKVDAIQSPEMIVAYLSSTTYNLYTYSSDTRLLLYKWQRREQVAPGVFADPDYRILASVSGTSRTISEAYLNTPVSQIPISLNPSGPNSFGLVTPFGSKEVLDAEFPVGDYEFIVVEDAIANNYGPYLLPGDDYPPHPEVQNFMDLQDFDVTQPQLIQWNDTPIGVSLVQVTVLDGNNSQVWFNSYPPGTVATELPADTLSPDLPYRLILRFWAPKTTNEKPPTALGFISSTSVPLNDTQGPGGEPVIDLAYVVKTKNFIQQDNTVPDTVQSWGMNAGLSGSMNITSASLIYPGGSAVLDGFDGEFDLSDAFFLSQEDLDASFPDGQYSLSVSTADTNTQFGPYLLSGSLYPDTPYVQNLEELGTHDHSTSFELTWNSFSQADADDVVLIEIYDDTDDQEVLFEFLDPQSASYIIAPNTFQPDRYYSIGLMFINRVDALGSLQNIVGYISRTEFTLSTHSSDTGLLFYKSRMHEQVSQGELQEVGYRPLAIVTGNSKTISYAELQTPVSLFQLNPFQTNSYLLTTAFGPKEILDTNYPPGEYRFGVFEDYYFMTYGPYDLPEDAYPGSPVVQDFTSLQVFDAEKDKLISWDMPSGDVTAVSIQVRDEAFNLVWSQGVDPLATSTTIPSHSLSQWMNYSFIIQFWARKSGSDNPLASVGYSSITRIPVRTSPYSSAYLEWLGQYFTEEQIMDAAIAGETVDHDNDKLLNYFEFLAHLDPTDANSKVTYAFSYGETDTLRIGPVPGDVSWLIESSSNLVDWSSVANESYEYFSGEITVQLENFQQNTFFRLVLSNPQ